MKQLKDQLQEALATGRLIARFGKSLFVLAVFTSTLNAIARCRRREHLARGDLPGL